MDDSSQPGAQVWRTMIGDLLLQFESLPGNALQRRESLPLPPDGLWRLLPEGAREFFQTFSGGVFRWPPLKFHLIKGAASQCINEACYHPHFPQTYPYYDRCFLFAEAEGPHFAFGLDLNPERLGWVFAYEDEDPGVSDTSYYLYKSFQEWLQGNIDAVHATPTGKFVSGPDLIGPVLRAT